MRAMRPMRCFVGPHRFVDVLRYAVCITTHQNATFWGLRTLTGAMTPRFKLGRHFCAMHLPARFIILCLLIRKLPCWQTNPQTQTQTNRRCRKHRAFFATIQCWAKIHVNSCITAPTRAIHCQSRGN